MGHASAGPIPLARRSRVRLFPPPLRPSARDPFTLGSSQERLVSDAQAVEVPVDPRFEVVEVARPETLARVHEGALVVEIVVVVPPHAPFEPGLHAGVTILVVVAEAVPQLVREG